MRGGERNPSQDSQGSYHYHARRGWVVEEGRKGRGESSFIFRPLFPPPTWPGYSAETDGLCVL